MLNAVLKVSIIADVVKMVQEALLNNKNGEFQADVFKAIAIEIVIYFGITVVLTGYRRVYNFYIHPYYQSNLEEVPKQSLSFYPLLLT